MGAGKNKALVVVALGLAGGTALAALTGGSARASEPEPQPEHKKVPSRVTLAKKYAKVFGVPVSLVLALIALQSSNRPRVKRNNKRGGAWGYGQVTLDTAKEIWPKASPRIENKWDQTGEGLLDPETNIGLTAYYLSLWWKRYKSNKLRWALSIYAYVLGPGRMRKVLPQDGGKLPKPLPSDVTALKKRLAKVIQSSEIQSALKGEKTTVSLGAEALYGKALSKTIPATTTGFQARSMFGRMTSELSRSYKTLANYDPTGLAKASKIDAGSIDAARQYLDSTNSMLTKYYPHMPESNEALSTQQLKELQTAVSTTSVAIKTIDDLFGTSFWKEFGAEIVQAAKTVAKTVNQAVGFSAGMIAAAAVGVGVLILAVKK